ncbi:unnamed protein product [Blepharisma stoltei]|uniref:HRDC domain-containing protein n=1 Tax=Blepharisma stoltei TaxID=1481888 RepID=A0AAU9JIL7_9CILI|nr:unnamed protein product [Blepharisma stoltei]
MSEYSNSILDPQSMRDFYSSMWEGSSTQYYSFFNEFTDYSANSENLVQNDENAYATIEDVSYKYALQDQFSAIYAGVPLALQESNAYLLPKPQNSFPFIIDNSSFPFVPKLLNKFHGKEEMIDYTLKAQQMRFGDLSTKLPPLLFNNPYKNELETLEFTKWQVNPIDSYFPDLESTPLQIVDNLSDLEKVIEEISNEREIAVDLEHHSLRSYQGFLCLIQISTRFKDYIIDPLKIPDKIYLLGEIFASPKIVKVMHGAINDIYWLQRDFGLYLVNMFDTGIASRELNKSSFSLAFLLKEYCAIDADKRYQLADWRLRPLTDDMVKYARMDTHYLLFIYDKVKEELIHKAMNIGIHHLSFVLSVLEASKQLCLNSYIKGEYSFQNPDKILNKLGQFRDLIARMEDESPEFLVSQTSLIKIAKAKPRTIEELSTIDSSPFILKYSKYILKHFTQKESFKPRNSSQDIFISSGWDKSQNLPYFSLYQKLSKQDGISPESIYDFCSDLDEKRTAYHLLRIIKEKSKADYIKGLNQSENLAPKKKEKTAVLDYANIDELLENTEVDENQIPKNMQEIYEISKCSKKKSKTKLIVAEEVTDVKCKGKEKSIENFLQEIGWENQ